MVSIAHTSVMAELTALQKDLERVTAQASATTRKGKPATIRRESMVARLADYQGMKAKVGLYAEMLGMRQQEIARSLDTLQQTARAARHGRRRRERGWGRGRRRRGQGATARRERARAGPGDGGRARRLMDGGEGPPRPLFSARRRRGLCARATTVDDTGHTRPAGGRETPERGPMATYDRTWLDHALGQADEIDANAPRPAHDRRRVRD